MNMIHPLSDAGIAEIGVYDTLKPVISPLLNHNLPRISGFLFAGCATTFLLDRLVNYSFDIRGAKLKISRVAIFILSGIAGAHFAKRFSLLNIPENVLKIQHVANGLRAFEVIMLVMTAGTIILAKKKNSYITSKGATAMLMAHLFVTSIYPTPRTLTSVIWFGNYAGLCASYMMTKK